ncbi:hypothetical protein [Dankookia sp. P2]|uniref:hypothetical protein n=1 Tax=Dankookia sp. P2 TaxID=3423955 RepID=UPI003D664245
MRVVTLAGSQPAPFDVASSLLGLDLIRPAGDAAQAELLFDPAAGHLVSAAGDLLAAELRTPQRLRAAVAKSAAIAALRGLPSGGLEIGLVRPGAVLREGLRTVST